MGRLPHLNRSDYTVKPELPALSRIQWQFFVTLSLRRGTETNDWAVRRFFALSRELAGWFKVHFLDLKWCLRSEIGEATERKHFHALYSGLPEHTVHQHTCFSIKNQAELMGWGMARCYVFNPSLDGVGYMLKQMETLDYMHSQGASLYEFSKFKPGVVTIAMSVLREIERRGHWSDTPHLKPSQTASLKVQSVMLQGRKASEQTGSTVQKPVIESVIQILPKAVCHSG